MCHVQVGSEGSGCSGEASTLDGGVSFLMPALLQWTSGGSSSSSSATWRWRDTVRGSWEAMRALLGQVQELLQALRSLQSKWPFSPTQCRGFEEINKRTPEKFGMNTSKTQKGSLVSVGRYITQITYWSFKGSTRQGHLGSMSRKTRSNFNWRSRNFALLVQVRSWLHCK
jgi:hypothetical protein